MVSKEILDAHVKPIASRALKKALQSKPCNFQNSKILKPGDVDRFWFASTKGNEQNEWIPAKVTATYTHCLDVKGLRRGVEVRG